MFWVGTFMVIGLLISSCGKRIDVTDFSRRDKLCDFAGEGRLGAVGGGSVAGAGTVRCGVGAGELGSCVLGSGTR